MKLKDYLKQVDISPERFGKRIGVSGQAVRRYLDGRMPRRSVIVAITLETSGEVTANDFVDVAPPKRRGRAAMQERSVA